MTRSRKSSAATLYGLLILLSATACPAQHLLAHSQAAEELQVSHDFWSFKEGAPETVIAFAQTADGFLWVGGWSGLVRFDGTRFEPFRSPLGDQLLSSYVTALLAARTGGLWVGYTFGGFSFLNNGRVTNYSSEPSSPTGTIHQFAEDRDGVIWARTTSGVWRFDHTRWQHLGADWNAPVTDVQQIGFDKKGILWVLTGVRGASDLLYLLPGSQRFQTAGRGVTSEAFLSDASGTIVTHSRDQARMPAGAGNLADGPADYPVLVEGSGIAFSDRTGGVWFDSLDASDTSVRRLPPSARPEIELSNSTARDAEVYRDIDPTVGATVVDREGNVWFGSPKGVHRFSYSPLIHADVSAELGNFTVAADDDGAVWIGSQAGVQHSSHGVNEPFKNLGAATNFAFVAPDKTLWLATYRDLWHVVGRNWARVALPPSMTNEARYLQTITQDRSGGMWISFGRHGLYRLAAGVWTSYGGREDLPKTGVLIEFTDGAGRVWFGYTNNQLAVLDGDRVELFGPKEGIRVGNITAIYGRGAEIWIGGEFGLQQFDHGQFHTITAVNDEWLRGISGIVETANGDLWLYGLSGIYHVRRAEIAAALKDPAHRIGGQHLGRRQGAPGLPAQLRPLPSAIEGSDGRLWFSGSSGVVWLDPAVREEHTPPPSVTIESISADDSSYALGLPLQFPAHTSAVQFTYAAVSLSNPEAIRYRYKLEETDKDWHEVPEAVPVAYRNLSPGSYHFSVSATDTDGAWSDKAATAAFTILPAFYQTPWFRALCIAAGVAALYFIYLLRVRHLARAFHLALEARVNERTLIARELHDTLLQSFQGLLLRFQTVRDLLRTRPAEAETVLNSAIDQTAQAITEGRNAVQGLRSPTAEAGDLALAIRTLGELAADETGNESTVLRVEVEGTPRKMDPILRDEVYRIAGEALRNAFRHAAAKQIEVELSYEERQLRLRVRDDGKGIDAELLSEERPAGHYGIRGMQERAKAMGGTLRIWSAPDSGAELELTIPAARAYATSHSDRRSWFDEKILRRQAQSKI